MRGTFLSCGIHLSVVTVTLLLTSCGDALVYGERTGFNLSLRADPSTSKPIEVNAGLRRSVVAIVPPKHMESQQDGSATAAGEAVNMFSRFELSYDESETSLFGGTLAIQSRFASGQAAVKLAPDANKVTQILKPAPVTPLTDSAANIAIKISQFINGLSADQAKAAAATLSVDDSPDAKLNIRRFIAKQDNEGVEQTRRKLLILFPGAAL